MLHAIHIYLMTTATTPTITELLLVYNSINNSIDSINYSAAFNVWPITYKAPELLL